MTSLPRGFRHVLISSGMRASAARTPDKPALVMADQTRSYDALVRRTNQLANALAQDASLKAGEHVALLSPNCMEYFEIMGAASDLGAAVATPNPRLTAAETTAIITDAQASILFLHPACEESFEPENLPQLRRVIRLGEDYENWIAQASDSFTPHDVPEWATFSIPYTSGTTGAPKGVQISHRSRTLGFHGMAAEYGVYGPDDRFFAIAPLCHGAGFSMAMASLHFGGTCQIAPRFDPEDTLRTLHESSATGAFFVPTHFHQMFDLESSVLDRYRGTTLRAILSNAAPLPQSTKERIVAYFGEGLLHELYGSTEMGIVSSLRPGDQLRKIKCVGLAFPNTEIRILNEDGEDTGPDEIGTLYARSPYFFNGYWGREEATNECYRGDWLTSGDLARQDDEGYVYIVGRQSDMVISGGINVYPREIEEVLTTHPAVREAAVIGVPDDRWGERLVAFVVIARDQDAEGLNLDEHCRQKLAGYKVPREFHHIDELPRNTAGKVVKGELLEHYNRHIAEKVTV